VSPLSTQKSRPSETLGGIEGSLDFVYWPRLRWRRPASARQGDRRLGILGNGDLDAFDATRIARPKVARDEAWVRARRKRQRHGLTLRRIRARESRCWDSQGGHRNIQ